MKHATVVLVVSVIAAFLLGCLVTQRHYQRWLGEADTVYLEKWVHDTIVEPYETVKVETRVVYLPVHDTTEVHDTTAVHDSVLVDVPIWEKSYASENYRLTIRGFEPELVDIWLNQKETLIKVPYRKPWSFTVGPQAGFGITPDGWKPYAGLGFTFGYSF